MQIFVHNYSLLQIMNSASKSSQDEDWVLVATTSLPVESCIIGMNLNRSLYKSITIVSHSFLFNGQHGSSISGVPLHKNNEDLLFVWWIWCDAI